MIDYTNLTTYCLRQHAWDRRWRRTRNRLVVSTLALAALAYALS